MNTKNLAPETLAEIGRVNDRIGDLMRGIIQARVFGQRAQREVTRLEKYVRALKSGRVTPAAPEMETAK